MSKTILITGAGSGLGAGSALGLAANGHKVIAVCYTAEQMAEMEAKKAELSIELTVDGPMDVTKAADRDMIFSKYGETVDIIVANAAIGEGGPLAELPTDKMRNNFDVNVFAQLDFVQPYIKVFAGKQAGKVVFISSIAATMVVPYLACYCMSKFALDAMAQGLQQELATTGVKVCTINPGPYVTGFNDTNIKKAYDWFSADKCWEPTEPLDGMVGAMATQMQHDPKIMYDEMVRLIPLDSHRFRNMHTPMWEVACKQNQAKMWCMDMDGTPPDDFWGKTEDGGPYPPDLNLDLSKTPIMTADEVRPMGL